MEWINTSTWAVEKSRQIVIRLSPFNVYIVLTEGSANGFAAVNLGTENLRGP